MTRYNRKHYFFDRQMDRHGPPLHVPEDRRRLHPWIVAATLATLIVGALTW